MIAIGGAIPDAVVSVVAGATILCIMFDLGLVVPVADYGLAWREPGLMLRGLFASVVAVPIVAIAVARAFGVSHAAEVGIAVTAAAPGAPIALRRAIGAGADRALAPALQVTVAVIAVVSMPLAIEVLDRIYGANAAIEPWTLAKQVFVVQLLPLGFGMAASRWLPAPCARIEPHLARVANALLAALVILALVDVWDIVWRAGGRTTLAIAAVVGAATAAGHLLGGGTRETRTAIALSCGARNVGLALLVASTNDAPRPVIAAILAYLAISALVLTPYVAWRRRRTRPREGSSPPGGRLRT